MVHYGRAPDEWFVQVLRHVRENRPHLWEAEVDVQAQNFAARLRNLQDTSRMQVEQTEPPPQPHPKSSARTTTVRPIDSRNLGAQSSTVGGQSSTAQVVINLATPTGEPEVQGPRPDL